MNYLARQALNPIPERLKFATTKNKDETNGQYARSSIYQLEQIIKHCQEAIKHIKSENTWKQK